MKKRWGVTKLCSCTLKQAGILGSSCTTSCQYQTNSREQKDPLYFLAAVWALLLWEYAEVDTVQIGVQEIFSSSTGSVKKQRMRLLTSSRSRTRGVSELLEPERWSVSNVSEGHCPYFNTGIVLYHGQGKEEVATLDSSDRRRRVQKDLVDGEQQEEVFPHHLLLSTSLLKKISLLTVSMCTDL